MKNNKKHKRLPPREYRLSDDFLITYSVEINKRNKNKENFIVRFITIYSNAEELFVGTREVNLRIILTSYSLPYLYIFVFQYYPTL